MKKPKGLSNYTYFTMTYMDATEEPSSFDYGMRIKKVCEENNIPYKTTYPIDDVPECTFWVKNGHVKQLRKLLKK